MAINRRFIICMEKLKVSVFIWFTIRFTAGLLPGVRFTSNIYLRKLISNSLVFTIFAIIVLFYCRPNACSLLRKQSFAGCTVIKFVLLTLVFILKLDKKVENVSALHLVTWA